MEVIERVIFNSLVQHTTVILPGFGTLSVVREEAGINSKNGIVVPLVKVTFTESILRGESILNIIFNMSGIDSKDIEPAYRHWLSDVKKHCHNGIYTINEVCDIHIIKGIDYIVVPSKELNKFLNPLDIDVIPLVTIVRPSAKDQKREAKRFTLVISSLVGVVLILIASITYFMNNDYFGQQEIEDSVIIDTLETVKAVDTLEPVDTIVEMSPVNNPEDIELSTAPESTPQPSAKSDIVSETVSSGSPMIYYVIAAVFSTEENARKFIAEQGSRSANCEIIPTSKGLFMVSVSKFDDQSSAQTEVSRLRNDNPSAWIFKQYRK